jgi:hypothetical protein
MRQADACISIGPLFVHFRCRSNALLLVKELSWQTPY